MTTQQVANRLVELCRQGNIMQAQQELYGQDMVSIEPGQPNAVGLPAVTEKGKQFAAMIEAHHGGHVSEPLVAGPYFSIAWAMDVTMKGRGRVNMEEVCVYKVKDGKIVEEQFFF